MGLPGDRNWKRRLPGLDGNIGTRSELEQGHERRGGSLDLFAVTAPGLEDVAAGELAGLGIAAATTPGGVTFSGGLDALYRANLHLRTASRVLVRTVEFRARSFIELERHARRIDWTPFLGPGRTVSLRVTSRKSKLYHERAIAERFGRWIGEMTGAEAALSETGPDEGEEEVDGGGQLIVIRFHRDECQISADSSGALLHRRGYRREVGKAPLRETLAAATLLAAGWRGDRPLLDPMCGSGTIPIEAALVARKIAPGLASADRQPRSYAFEAWPGFDTQLWQRVVEDARGEIRPRAACDIVGSDRDEGAIEAARANAERAGVAADVRLEAAAVSAAPTVEGAGLLLTNPPYGVRVGETKALRDLYAAIGNLARARLPGWRVGMLAADEGLVRQTGLEMREVLATRNGGIPVRLVLGGG